MLQAQGNLNLETLMQIYEFIPYMRMPFEHGLEQMESPRIPRSMGGAKTLHHCASFKGCGMCRA